MTKLLPCAVYRDVNAYLGRRIGVLRRQVNSCAFCFAGNDHSPGFHGDLNGTYAVGEIDEDSKKLIHTTREALRAAIAICKPGALFRDIGKVM